jgi:serine protease AprX
VPQHRKPSGRRGRWLTVTAAALPLAVLPAAITPTAGVATVAGDASNHFAGIWNSTTTSSGGGTTLASIRSIIGADTGAAATLTGKGIGIALIDTGVAAVPGIPKAQIVNGPDLSFESQAGDLRYQDTYGHGTHMAGIMVANDAATGVKGLAPGAKVTSLKVGTSNGAVDVSQMLAAIDWVVKYRNHDPAYPIRVLNISYGTGGNPPFWTDPVQFAVEKAWQAGIVVVVAAGNQGNNYGKLTNPATDLNVIAVGAASTKGTVTVADDTLTTFTNLDGGRPLDILAPGESVTSLRVPGSNIDNQYAGARVGETLFKGTGTSQAAAVVSSAVALILQARPTLKPEEVKDMMMKGGVYIPNGAAGGMGLGMVNVNNTLARPVSAQVRTWALSDGTGSLEAARGPSHVVNNNVTLTGERSVFGTFNSAAWAAKSASQTSWSGGTWMGTTVAGSGWTGTSYAGKTWGGATWGGQPWGGSTTWSDPNWSGRFWSGRFWSGGTWVARFWSSDDWSTAYWG